MSFEKREIKKGIYAQVEVCPKCLEEFIDLKEHEKVYREYYSKAFKSGNSLAVRIPKELADKIGLQEGTPLKIGLGDDGKITIEARA
ncbi:AbrB/MazE/SpoVT family DNA-binding domain-containing protein [Methanocella sp. MCL-LM]|uniref:AbrB/MazE/SpoVT family DNA-binding domain-containing protein n=1 Tax=Methanocella sp. MCL-LM TaxID=3412035 RepID=UPI003C711419